MNKFIKKVFGILLSFVLICSTFTLLPTTAVSAESLTPNLSSSAYNSSNIFTQCGYKGQCTWFVWGRTLEKLGIRLNSQFYGNAKTWYNETTYSKGSTPKSNSIGVFCNGTWGHVVFVEKVSGDTIYFNEANHHVRGQYDGALESASTYNFKTRAGSGNFLGFIYVGGTSTPPTQVSSCNAQISGDWAYVRNSDGSVISGRRVDDGDHVKVKEINYERQLALVEYPIPGGTYTGWITNCSIIHYYYQGQYKNGSTSETVYDSNGKTIGSLNPYETATPLFRNASTGRLYVVYNTSKGTNTKGGYVVYNGGFNKF